MEALTLNRVKQWRNLEHDIKVGLSKDLTFYKWGEDYLRIKLPEDKSNHRFYQIEKQKKSSTATAIRILKLGAISPERIGSIHELNRYVSEPADKLTINYHCSDRLAMMYYGQYDRRDYIDTSKINIPEMRVLAERSFNDPMIMDPTLKLVDVHYVDGRDDPQKIHDCLAKAITDYLTKRKIVVKSKGWKLYWKDKGKWVKFYSGAPLGGHYYFYINLGIDYDSALDYFKVISRTKDRLAYGLPNIPESMIDEVLDEFAKLYGLPVEAAEYSETELIKLEELDELHRNKDWVKCGQREYPNIDYQKNIDGFEHEFDLYEKPDSNVICFDLEHSGLDFYYQHALSREEIAQGKERPEHVVGSYAVYHKTKIHNKYKTGKFGHIYRPVVWDAAGNQVYAKLHIEKEQMSITIPQEFLNSANYPITVDPTFGYTTVGGSTINFTAVNNYCNLLSITGVAGTVGTFYIYQQVLAGGSNPINIVAALYLHSDNSLKDYSAQNQYTSTTTAPAWIPYAGTQSFTTSAVAYDIGIEIGIPTTASYVEDTVYFDTSTNAGGTTTSNTYASPPPATQPTVTIGNDKFSVYVSTPYVASSSTSLFSEMF